MNHQQIGRSIIYLYKVSLVAIFIFVQHRASSCFCLFKFIVKFLWRYPSETPFSLTRTTYFCILTTAVDQLFRPILYMFLLSVHCFYLYDKLARLPPRSYLLNKVYRVVTKFTYHECYTNGSGTRSWSLRSWSRDRWQHSRRWWFGRAPVSCLGYWPNLRNGSVGKHSHRNPMQHQPTNKDNDRPREKTIKAI